MHDKHRRHGRRRRSLLDHAAVALFVFLATVFVVLAVTLIKEEQEPSLELEIEPVLSELPPTQQPIKSEKVEFVSEDLSSGTFTDIFSGIGWINAEKTTLGQDLVTSAFAFEPKFVWEKADISVSSDDSYSDSESVVCLTDRCLSLRDGKLEFDSRELTLPLEFESGAESLSIGKTDSFWLVGGVVKDGHVYRGFVYSFDGANFRKLQSVSSRLVFNESGILGFGGADNDWVLVYGSVSGSAFRVRSSLISQDLSGFLNPRIMKEGFRPVVFRLDFDRQPTWYVYSATKDRLKLFKFFQNNTDSVEGVVDYTSRLTLSETGSMKLASQSSSSPVFYITLSGEQGGETKRFVDEGFAKTGLHFVESLNVGSTNVAFVTAKARIRELDVSKAGGSFDLYLSSDGVRWVKAMPGSFVDLSGQKGAGVFWRGVVKGEGNKYAGVFLKKITIEYQVKLQN